MTLKLYILISSNSACLIDIKYQSWEIILWAKKKDKTLHSKKYNCEHQGTTYKNDCKVILSGTGQPQNKMCA